MNVKYSFYTRNNDNTIIMIIENNETTHHNCDPPLNNKGENFQQKTENNFTTVIEKALKKIARESRKKCQN